MPSVIASSSSPAQADRKPIFCATHPRACSTAFERVFMTQRDTLSCVHEPFGDAFYYGPERLSSRYDNDEAARKQTGFADTTYADVLKSIEEASEEGTKRIFIKDIIHYLFPPNKAPADIAHSVDDGSSSNGDAADSTSSSPSSTPSYSSANPTVLPIDVLRRFQFTFLIRHPRRSIPSYYRCTIPPLDDVTGFYDFDPAEAGYDELRRFFDFVLAEGIVDRENLAVIDADDLLDDPEGVLRAYCERVGLDFCRNMLEWSDEDTAVAKDKFAKWEGFHYDALRSSSLRPRAHRHKTASPEAEYSEWEEKYGAEGAKVIRQTVDDNVADYEYLKKFALQV